MEKKSVKVLLIMYIIWLDHNTTVGEVFQNVLIR